MATRCYTCNAALKNDEAASGVCPRCGGRVSYEAAKAKLGSKNPKIGEIACPCCQQPSDSIKCFNMSTLLFLFVFGAVWRREQFGCPSCIRGKIVPFLLINLLTANVLWPFIIVPWGLIMLLLSFQKGHSSGVTNFVK